MLKLLTFAEYETVGISANGISSRRCLMIITHHTNSKAALVLILERKGRQQGGWKKTVE
jgi:hypothetical protein